MFIIKLRLILGDREVIIIIKSYLNFVFFYEYEGNLWGVGVIVNRINRFFVF